MTQLTFSTDRTGRDGFRKDYAGGVVDGHPYLEMGGFFDTWLEAGTVLERTPSVVPPTISFSTLP